MKAYVVLALTAGLLVPVGCATTPPPSFATPAEAVHRLAAAADDERAAEELLGPGGFSALRSGDDVADREDLETVRAMVRERLDFVDVAPDYKIARLGAGGWELPIPLVRDAGGRWTFDVEVGREEVLNRRVGRNELSTIATLRALVEAQLEYAAEGRDGNPPGYAGKFFSSDGRHDGLYWPVREREEESPLGPFVAAAGEEGYRRSGSEPVPYHGYFYRILTAQGPSAPRGARSYLDANGQLTGGFGVVAWPATYDNSGRMTFLVNQQGIVFEKDLGPATAEAASAIRAYDPDASWTPTID
jgi:hypothetical protein